jgi:hypothetical protein
MSKLPSTVIPRDGIRRTIIVKGLTARGDRLRPYVIKVLG